MPLNKIATFLFFFQLFGVRAQVVNIENKRIYDDTSGWSGAIDASFSAFKNANTFISSALRPRIQYKTPRHYYFLLGDMMYTKGQDRVYANMGMSHFRYAYRIKGPWKWESYLQIQYNKLLDQQRRSLVGSGIRYKFYDNKKSKFFAGTSVFYEYEQILSTSMENFEFRGSNYISCYIDPKTTYTFTAASYYQPLLENWSDFRFMGQYTFSFKVSKRIDIRTELTAFYDSDPLVNVPYWTFNTSFGIHFRVED